MANEITTTNLCDWIEEQSENKRWLIDDLIPEDGLILLSGQQKLAFKTWFAFATAIAISSGKSMSMLKPNRKAGVLIIEEEGGKAQTRSRFLAIAKGFGANKEDLENIHFSFRNRVKLDNPVHKSQIKKLCEKHKPGLVILDALTYLHSGDENKIQDMLKVVDTINMIRSMGISVLIIAHLDKTRGSNVKTDIDLQIRGSSIISNSYDIHLALRRFSNQQKTIALTARARDEEEKFYKVDWKILSNKDKVAEYASVSLSETDLEGLNILTGVEEEKPTIDSDLVPRKKVGKVWK